MSLSRTQVFDWYGTQSVDNDNRSGRLSTSTTPEYIAIVEENIRANRWKTIHDVFFEVGVRDEMVHAFSKF